MSFDISKLTTIVNKYLNSISDVSNLSKKAEADLEAKTRFSIELGDAIRQNIESRMRDEAVVPDISEQVNSAVGQTSSRIDATIEQINGAFESISSVGGASSVNSGSSMSVSDSSNSDAYSGTLSPEALQELSKSQYFSSNLIQSSLLDMNSSGDGQESSASSGSSLEGLSLSDLNSRSLLANSFSQAVGSLSSDEGTADLGESGSSSDIAKALIKAYATSGNTSQLTSVFGDFSL